jgi:hypothetical protein
VGDSTGESAYHLHPAGLLQAGFQPRAFSFHRASFNCKDNGIECRAQETELAGLRNPETPADRIKTQGNARAIVIDVRHAHPSTQSERNARLLVLSCRH